MMNQVEQGGRPRSTARLKIWAFVQLLSNGVEGLLNERGRSGVNLTDDAGTQSKSVI